MNSITSDPIFQIVMTVFLTLLGTAAITYLFYRKQKKDNDHPEVTYRIENLNQKSIFIIHTLFTKPIHHITLKSTKPKGKPGHRAWIESIKSTEDVDETRLLIPKTQCSIPSFEIKIQYQYREHKYTDKLRIYPTEGRCELQ